MALHGDLRDVDARGVREHLDDPAAKREIGQGASVMYEMPEPLAQLAELRFDLLDGRLATLVA